MSSSHPASNAELVRSIRVAPSTAVETYELSPLDLYAAHVRSLFCVPLFFNYDVDGDRFVEALKMFLVKYPILMGRAREDEFMRCVIEVDPKKESHGIVFTEMRTNMSVAEATFTHAEVKSNAYNSGVFHSAPFFLDINDINETISGQKDIMTARLTHFRDGCCIGVCIPHMITDAYKFDIALSHLSNAYRDISIPEIVHDRSHLWPDRLAETVMWMSPEIGLSQRGVTPRPMEDELALSNFPEDPCRNLLLPFTNEVIQEMKEKIKPFLKEGEDVSSTDITMAILWMLECELTNTKQPITTGADLDIENTHIIFVQDIEWTDPRITPEPYFGHRSIYVAQHNKGDGLNDASLPEVLARLAGMIQQTVDNVRSQADVAVQGLLLAYEIIAAPNLVEQPPLEKRRMICTDVSKMGNSGTDFGSGIPVYAQPSLYPMLYDNTALCPGLGQGGMVVQRIVLDRQTERLKASAVLKELAPSLRDFLEYSVEEVKDKLHLKDL